MPKTLEKTFFKIIIPNYNNMPYIKQCLDSILEQTFQDFKIIVVDDLSTDLSDKFCEMYAQKYPDKIYYKQLNKKGYAGAARNAGINYLINSSYNLFIDSDDWIYDNNVLFKLYNIIIKNNFPKLIRCPLYHVSNKKQYVENLKKQNIVDMLMIGSSPSRNCVRSDVHFYYKENRSINNDVIGNIRLFDQINMNDIYIVDFPCITYNESSILSVQHNKQIKNSLIRKIDELKFLDDIKNENVQQNHSKQYISRILTKFKRKYQNMYKQITLSDLNKYSTVISIDVNQFNFFKNIFSKFSITPTLFHGIITHNNKAENCKQSHISIITHAKNNNWPFVLIFEDDAYPCENCLELLLNYLKIIPKDADLLLLGWSYHNKSSKQLFELAYNKVITPTISGTHAYIVFQSGYNAILNYFKNNPHATADNKTFMSVKNSYILDKPLFIQFNKTKSVVNGHCGYIYYGDHELPPTGFLPIEKLI